MFQLATAKVRTFAVKEPFAMLISGGYARVRLTTYYYYRTTLKALYFVMNNTRLDGKLTARLTIYQQHLN